MGSCHGSVESCWLEYTYQLHVRLRSNWWHCHLMLQVIKLVLNIQLFLYASPRKWSCHSQKCVRSHTKCQQFSIFVNLMKCCGLVLDLTIMLKILQFCCLCLWIQAKLVQATYVSSVIENLPQRNGVIDVSLVIGLTADRHYVTCWLLPVQRRWCFFHHFVHQLCHTHTPADATATPLSLASLKSRLVYLDGAGLPGCPGKKVVKQM